MRKTILLTLAMISASAVLHAQTSNPSSSDFYVIPVVAHTTGVGGTLFMSDVAITNTSSAPLQVDLAFVQSGQGANDNVFPVASDAVANGSLTVPAGGSVLLRDVLKNQVGLTTGIGALLVGADQPFTLTSRAYTTTANGGTIGQNVPPSAGFIDSTVGTTGPNAAATIPGLIANAQYRTNLGFVAANASGSGGPLKVLVTLRDAAGTTLGTQTYVINSGSIEHLQLSSRNIADKTFDIGSAEFRITEGNGAVVPYASVVDNISQDAVLIEGQFPDSVGSLSINSIFRRILSRVRQ